MRSWTLPKCTDFQFVGRTSAFAILDRNPDVPSLSNTRPQTFSLRFAILTDADSPRTRPTLRPDE